MGGIYRLTDRGMHLACAAAGLLAGGVVVFITCVVAAEVLLRLAGLPAFGWTLELCEYGLVVISFLGAPWVLRNQEHITVDILLRQVGPRTATVLLTVADVVSAVACLIIARFAAMAASDSFARGAILFKYFETPQWIVLAILPLGATLLALEFVLRIWRRLAGHPRFGAGEATP